MDPVCISEGKTSKEPRKRSDLSDHIILVGVNIVVVKKLKPYLSFDSKPSDSIVCYKSANAKPTSVKGAVVTDSYS